MSAVAEASPAEDSSAEDQETNFSSSESDEDSTIAEEIPVRTIMAVPIGTISEFNPQKEDFFMYKRRLDIWMTVNKVTAEDKANVFLALVGPSVFEVVTNMCFPANPSTKSYDDLVKIAENHYQTVRNTVTERVVFRERKQKPGESISQYIVELKMLSRHCEYGDALPENLRDAFVSGLSDLPVRRKLLGLKELTWEIAQQQALAWEAAQRDAEVGAVPEKQTERDTVHQVSKKNIRRQHYPHPQQEPKAAARQQQCGRCLGNHREEKCPHQKDRCFNCNRYGHISRACRNKKKKSSGKLHQVENVTSTTQNVTSTKENVTANLWTVKDKRDGEITETVTVEGYNMKFVVDTAAAVSVISEQQYNEVLSHKKIEKTRIQLESYSGTLLSVVGQIKVKVRYKETVSELPLVIVKGQKPALLGRNWLKVIRLDWKNIFETFAVSKSQALEEIFEEYECVFSKKKELNTIKDFKAVIQLKPDAQPIFKKARPVPYALRDKVAEELDTAVQAGVLKPVNRSDWAAPIVVVPKSDGNIRICGDYKVTVNRCIEDESYPLPTPEDLFSTLAGGAVFTKLDLSSAYQQLQLAEESKKLLTINTHKGLYQYQRLPFGVSTAPSIFQGVMDQILKGIDGVVCYLDDILISTRDIESHAKTLRLVLGRLKDHEILVKRSKCEIGVSEVEYLGHRVNKDGLQCTSEKVEAIHNAPKPQNVSELRTYLGMVTYYQKFIPNLADKFAPLYKLLRDDSEWEWTVECDKAIEEVKKCLTGDSVLVHYDGKLPITLATDASPHGIGAVISHVIDGQERPIAFASKTLAAAERNYPQIEREALGIIYGVKKFHKYLYGRKFVLITDNKPLTAIFAPDKEIPALSALRLQRWALILSSYQYEIKFRCSSENANADVLSRFPVEDITEIELPINHFSLVDELPVTAKDVADETRKDKILSRVYVYMMNGWPSKTDPELLEFAKRKDEISAERGCLLWGMRVIIPEAYRRLLVKELHKDHLGVVRMKAVARSYFWYPGIDRDIEMESSCCEACQTYRADPPPAPLRPWKTPSHPWERIHIDFGYIKGVDILVVIDSSTKWMEVAIMNSTTADKTIDVLRGLFARHGLPKEVVSDNGPQFASREFGEFLRRNQVKHTLVPAYHPASNGAAEKSVQTVKNALKKYLFEEIGTEKTTMQQKLDNFLLTYRTTPHSTTNCSPASLFYKRDLRTRFTLLRPDLQSEIIEKQQKQMKYHDNKQTRYSEFSENETVRVRNYIGGKPKWSIAKVIKRLGEYRYLVIMDNHKRQVHIEQMIKFSAKDDKVCVMKPTEFDQRPPEVPTKSTVGSEISKENEMPTPEVLSESGTGLSAPALEAASATTEPRRSSRNRKAPERLIEKM
jgi:transposase InsO family protein